MALSQRVYEEAAKASQNTDNASSGEKSNADETGKDNVKEANYEEK